MRVVKKIVKLEKVLVEKLERSILSCKEPFEVGKNCLKFEN